MPPSRRRTLALLAAASVPLAGCNGDAIDSGSASTPTPTEPADGSRDSDGTGRGDSDLPPYGYLRSNEHAAVAFREDRPTQDDGPRYPHSFLVDTQERADEIEYRDVDGTAAVRAFVDETDFDAATVFVDQRSIPACYRLELCSMTWTETSMDLSLERVPLPYDVACDADAEAVEARFIRIPQPLDREDVTSWGSSTGSGSCPNAPSPEVGTPVPGADESTTNGADESTTNGTRTNESATGSPSPRSTTGGDA